METHEKLLLLLTLILLFILNIGLCTEVRKLHQQQDKLSATIEPLKSEINLANKFANRIYTSKEFNRLSKGTKSKQ